MVDEPGKIIVNIIGKVPQFGDLQGPRETVRVGVRNTRLVERTPVPRMLSVYVHEEGLRDFYAHLRPHSGRSGGSLSSLAEEISAREAPSYLRWSTGDAWTPGAIGGEYQLECSTTRDGGLALRSAGSRAAIRLETRDPVDLGALALASDETVFVLGRIRRDRRSTALTAVAVLL